VKLAQSGKKIRKWILDTPFSSDFEDSIKNHYESLIKRSPKGTTFAGTLLQRLPRIYQMRLLLASKKVF
jgi:phosphoenolpyruvate synthase/pyruvate phosphate dikinase